VIAAAAFCPYPPLLVPELAGGAAAELEPVRDACRNALTSVHAAADRLVLIGAAPTSAFHSPVARGSLSGHGVAVDVQLGSPACGGWRERPRTRTVGPGRVGVGYKQKTQPTT
jgi:hypothetical protein